VTKEDYKPSMEPSLHENADSTFLIQCSDEYVRSLGIGSDDDQEFLQAAVVGQAICPKLWWFKDSERARKLLGVTPETKVVKRVRRGE